MTDHALVRMPDHAQGRWRPLQYEEVVSAVRAALRDLRTGPAWMAAAMSDQLQWPAPLADYVLRAADARLFERHGELRYAPDAMLYGAVDAEARRAVDAEARRGADTLRARLDAIATTQMRPRMHSSCTWNHPRLPPDTIPHGKFEFPHAVRAARVVPAFR